MDKDKKIPMEENNDQRSIEKGFSDAIKNAHASGDGAINRGNEAIESDKEEGEAADTNTY